MRVTDPLGEYEVLDSMIDVGTKSVTWNLRMVALPRSSSDSLRGRVTTTSGTAVPGVRLRVFEGAGGGTAAAVSRRDGTYSMQVDPGTRSLAVSPPSGKGYAQPKPREVVIGTKPRVADVVLRKAGAISGTIRPATAGRTLSAYATLYDASGAPLRDTGGDAGAYRIDGLLPGTYFVCARGTVYDVTGGAHQGITQFWSKRYTLASATKIVVREGQEVTRTDLVLGTRLVNLSPPAIAGKAKAGSTLTVGRGRWNVERSDDESPTYAWYRGKKLVATNDDGSYVLTSADIGKSIRVEVTLAHPSYDTSRPVSSAPTATVVR